MTSPMHPEPSQAAISVCPCGAMFRPRKLWQAFCGASCRSAYDAEVGATGTVASVRKLTRGRVSVIVRLEGPAAERAINLSPGDRVRAVRQP